MTVLDFYKVINDKSFIDLYGEDDEIDYFYGKASDIPVKYLDLAIRHIAAVYRPNTKSIDYTIWV